MKIIYRESFIRDLKNLKETEVYNSVSRLVFETMPSLNGLHEVKNLKRLRGHHDKARIRIGSYRIGIHIGKDVIEIVRILHRKEIYRAFP